MPFAVTPLEIEQSDFSGAYAPDVDDTGTEPGVLSDMLNLLPDTRGSDALVTRKGFKRIREELGATAAHYVLHVWPFRGNGTSYLICVVTDGTSTPNNVRLYAINMNGLTVARIDTAGRTWANPKKPHWGMTIQEVFYGGSPGNDVYSWDPATSTWNATAHTKVYDTLVDSTSPGAGEKARDFAFKGDEVVTYLTHQYSPAKGIRFDKWEDGQYYGVGERVSLKVAIGGFTYWRSYKCKQAHTSVLADNQPGTGANQATYWQKVRLPLPVNADGETSDRWYFKPVAPGSSVAAWHADRFWIRYDGQGDKSRVLYSAPVEPEKGKDVPDVVFDMTDFVPGNDVRGPGGGWLMFNDGRMEGIIESMWSYGQYLLVFKRQSTWVMTGRSEPFTVRRLARGVGAVGPYTVAELNGLVYFLSDDGLYVTDGTAVEPVPGLDKVRQTLIARIDAMAAEGAAGNVRDPVLWAWDDMLWMSLSAEGDTSFITLVYDPRRAAWYKTDLPVLFARPARHFGVPHCYFTAVPEYGGASQDLVMEYAKSDANNLDDTAADVYAGQAYAWNLRTTWWPFGLHRQQRRIRRVWAVVKGALTYTLKAYKDWSDTEVKSTARVVAGADPTHIEGERFADSHAVSFRLSSTAAPASVYGIAVSTEPRRLRYHH